MLTPHKLPRLIFAAAFISSAVPRLCVGEPPGESGDASTESRDRHRLVWCDEFDQDGPVDPSKWKHERGFVRNHELQWYQPPNASCRGGLLVLEARREQVANPGYRETGGSWSAQRPRADYTSSSISTEGLASWKYGRFEMRGRIDVRLGMWPAWWTLGVSNDWPRRGEIDMMEFYRGTLLANAAWARDRHEPRWNSVRTPLRALGDDWGQAFHTWRMDWNADQIALFVDGRLLNRVDLAQTINETPDRENPFRQNHFMLLSLAIGGDNGGDPADTEFPARFEIDYVRVYQQP